MISVYSQKAHEMWCATAIEDEKIWTTTFAKTEEEAVKQVLETLPYNKQFKSEGKTSELAQRVFDTMKSVLNGEDVSFNFQFEQNRLTEYSRKVLGCLTQVPVGYVTTYKALADSAGGGPRAVGGVMRSNPFSPLIPCHRVVKSDFSIGGYGGSVGEWTKVKRKLLQLEDRGFDMPSEIKTACGPLQVFPVRFLKRS